MLDSLVILASFWKGALLAAPQPAEIKPPVAAVSLSANDVVDRVQSFYVKTPRLTAKFRQTYTNVDFGRKSKSDGRLWISKPGKMRWDYYAKARKGKKPRISKSFVSDSTTLWAIEHDNKQYFKKTIKDDLLPVAVTFLYGKGDLRSDFRASLDTSGRYGKKSNYVLKMLPKKAQAAYKTLYLVVDKNNHRVLESVVVEASGNTNHFRFYEPNFKKAIAARSFVVREAALRKLRYKQIKPPKK